MNDKRMKGALENIARRGVSENINLMPRITAQLERKSPMKTLRSRPFAAILIALFILLMLSGVAYALGKSLGYIPGVGIVDQSAPLRVLAEPVSQTRDGITITVSTVVADSEKTFVAYSVDGIVVQAGSSPMTCGMMPSLSLPNGVPVNKITEDDGGPLGAKVGSILKIEQSVTYSYLPSDVNSVTLTFPCILPDVQSPQNWQIQLMLLPAPKDFAIPGVEIGVTAISHNPKFVISPTAITDMRIFTPEPFYTPPATYTPAPNGSGLYLERVIELPDSYILFGNFTDAGDLPGVVEYNVDPNADLPRIEDGAGNPVPFKVRADITPVMGWGVRYWAFEIAKPVHGPLTITVDQISISKSYTSEFMFEAEPNSQLRQTWDLNLLVRLGSHQYIMDSVTMIENEYLFKYHSGKDAPEGVSLLVNIIGQTPISESSEVNSGDTTVEYTEKITFASPFPTGLLTVDLTSMESSPLPGPWVLIWTPPNQ